MKLFGKVLYYCENGVLLSILKTIAIGLIYDLSYIETVALCT